MHPNEIWQPVEFTSQGTISVLIIQGKRTQRKAFFPHPKLPAQASGAIAVKLNNVEPSDEIQLPF